MLDRRTQCLKEVKKPDASGYYRFDHYELWSPDGKHDWAFDDAILRCRHSGHKSMEHDHR